MTGSTGIMGVADTGMILRKEDRFGDNATLCITGRDVEEKKTENADVRREMGNHRGLSADDLRKERIPDFVFKVVDFFFLSTDSLKVPLPSCWPPSAIPS